MTRVAAILLWLVGASASALAGLAPPVLVLAERSFDFAQQPLGARLAHRFVLANRGETPLLLGLARVSLAGIDARFPREIAPGGVAAIDVTWETTGREGGIEAELAFRSSDPARPSFILTVRARLEPAIAIEPRNEAFVETWHGESGETSLRILVRDQRPTAIVRVVAAGTHFEAELSTRRPGLEYELLLRVPASVEAGRFREALVLHTDRPDLPELRVEVNVLVKSEIHATPERIEFGELPLSLLLARPDPLEPIQQSMILTRKEGEFEVVGVECDLVGLLIERDPPAGAARSFRFQIGVPPERLTSGALEGTLRIQTSDPRFPVIEIPIGGRLRGN